MKNTLLLFLAAIILTACITTTPTETGYSQVRVKGPVASAAERAACDAVGGVIERAGMAGYERCTQRYADGGALCSDSVDCQGKCIAPRDAEYGPNSPPITGQCQTTDNPFGCYGEVEQGQVFAMLCVD